MELLNLSAAGLNHELVAFFTNILASRNECPNGLFRVSYTSLREMMYVCMYVCMYATGFASIIRRAEYLL